MTDPQNAWPLWLGLSASCWVLWLGVESNARLERTPLITLCIVTLLSLGLWWPAGSLSTALPWTDWRTLTFPALAAVLTAGAMLALLLGPRDGQHRLVSRIASTALASLLLAAALASLLIPAKPQGSELLWVLGLGALQALLLLGALTVRRPAMPAPLLRGMASLSACLLPLAWRAPMLADAQGWPAGPVLLSLPLLGMLALSGLLLARQAPVPAMLPISSADAVLKALTDPLTQLPSRQAVERELEALAVRCDHEGHSMAVLIFNLDGFQNINNNLGHDVGDQVLRDVAKRMTLLKGAHERIGRIAADEFVLITPYAMDMRALSARVSHVLTELSHPFSIAGQALPLGCSAGIALYPDHGAARRLLNCANQASLAAKRLGGACFSVYTPGMEQDGRLQLELLKDLHLAIDRKEMELFFQPKIDAASGQVTAAEALLRWHHPTKGLISPTVFIPVAERFGLMRELGNWVIEAACMQARRWRDEGLRMRVAINLSVLQMRQRDIVERIERALAEHRIQPNLLTCEITESVAMEDTQATQQTFARLGELGVHLSIDDFGTGYSSLAYLRKLPASELKIDRSFVSELDSNSNAWAVVQTIVHLAHTMNMRVVAEGVETEAQQKYLIKLGCDELQGYLYAKPMSADAILLWAKNDSQTKAPEFRASLFGDTLPQELS